MLTLLRLTLWVYVKLGAVLLTLAVVVGAAIKELEQEIDRMGGWRG